MEECYLFDELYSRQIFSFEVTISQITVRKGSHKNVAENEEEDKVEKKTPKDTPKGKSPKGKSPKGTPKGKSPKGTPKGNRTPRISRSRSRSKSPKKIIGLPWRLTKMDPFQVRVNVFHLNGITLNQFDYDDLLEEKRKLAEEEKWYQLCNEEDDEESSSSDDQAEKEDKIVENAEDVERREESRKKVTIATEGAEDPGPVDPQLLTEALEALQTSYMEAGQNDRLESETPHHVILKTPSKKGKSPKKVKTPAKGKSPKKRKSKSPRSMKKAGILKKLSKPAVEEEEEGPIDSWENFQQGTMVVFSSSAMEIMKSMQKSSIEVVIFRYNGLEEEPKKPVKVGKSRIQFEKNSPEIILQSLGDKSLQKGLVNFTLAGNYPLKDLEGTKIGQIQASFTLSCYGKSVTGNSLLTEGEENFYRFVKTHECIFDHSSLDTMKRHCVISRLKPCAREVDYKVTLVSSSRMKLINQIKLNVQTVSAAKPIKLVKPTTPK